MARAKYKVVITPTAKQDMSNIKAKWEKGIPDKPYKEVLQVLQYLANINPRPPIVKREEEGMYRIRIDDYRLHYSVDDKEKKIIIHRIRQRLVI